MYIVWHWSLPRLSESWGYDWGERYVSWQVHTTHHTRPGARLVRSQGSTGEISGPAELSQAGPWPWTALTSHNNYNYQEAIRPELTDPAQWSSSTKILQCSIMAWRQCCLPGTRQVVWPAVLTWAVPPSPAIWDLSDHYNKHHQATSARGNLHINIINALVRNLTFPKVGIYLSLSLSLSFREGRIPSICILVGSRVSRAALYNPQHKSPHIPPCLTPQTQTRRRACNFWNRISNMIIRLSDKISWPNYCCKIKKIKVPSCKLVKCTCCQHRQLLVCFIIMRKSARGQNIHPWRSVSGRKFNKNISSFC